MQPGANRHQQIIFDALAQSRSSADPKFRLIGVSSARVDYARDVREAAPLKLKIMQPGANRHQHRLSMHQLNREAALTQNSD
jgi:hypothetical protein